MLLEKKIITEYKHSGKLVGEQKKAENVGKSVQPSRDK